MFRNLKKPVFIRGCVIAIANKEQMAGNTGKA